MAETDDDTETNDPRVKNYTIPSRSRPRTKEVLYNLTATFPHYFIPKRPRVVKMRDLSPETKAQLSKEYYEAYDPWTGIRIAATLGILISLFTLFLTYKSKYHKSRNAVITSKKTSLYLYEDDLDCDLGNLGSSDDTGSFAFSYRYGVDNRLPGTHEYNFGLKECYPMEEIFVKSSVVECVALTLHKNQKGSKGPKYGTLRITDDASRSLPCSPYTQKKKTKSSTAVPQDSSSKVVSTTAKQPYSPTSPPAPERDASFSGSITSFGSNDTDGGSHVKPTVFSKSRGRSSCKTETAYQSVKSPKTDVTETGAREDENGDSPVPKNTMVVSSKRPQDYRSRSTVVTIGRRKRKS